MTESEATKDAILEKMNEPMPLPMGRKEFDEWSDRIIGGALLKGDPNEPEALFIDSQKFALAQMILHLGPTESHKPDAYFIHSLRKTAANQIAHAVATEKQKVVKAYVAAREEEAKLKLVGEPSS